MTRTYRKVGIVSFLMLLLANLGKGDINKDKAECSNQLVGLSTCLPYVGGEAKAPTPDCCAGLKQVLRDSKKCLCILVKDRNDPSLGLNVNATLALSLPQACRLPLNANVSDCTALLHLSPNSPEAKVFSDFGKAAAPAGATPASSSDKSAGGGGTSAKETSDSAKGKRWMSSSNVLWSLALVFSLTPCLLI